MTNPTRSDPGARLDPAALALPTIGGRRRPVKVVEHPAFRAARLRAAFEQPFTVVRVPVVVLSVAAEIASGGCTTPAAVGAA